MLFVRPTFKDRHVVINIIKTKSWAELTNAKVSAKQVASAISEILVQLNTLEANGMLRGADTAAVQHSRISGTSNGRKYRRSRQVRLLRGSIDEVVFQVSVLRWSIDEVIFQVRVSGGSIDEVVFQVRVSGGSIDEVVFHVRVSRPSINSRISGTSI